jgi:hypothetical protein
MVMPYSDKRKDVIPKGWSKPIDNQGKNTCDIDGAKLWIGPGDQIYCDSDHNPRDVLMLQNAGKNDSLHNCYRDAKLSLR